MPAKISQGSPAATCAGLARVAVSTTQNLLKAVLTPTIACALAMVKCFRATLF
jgi:hypothetical protein